MSLTINNTKHWLILIGRSSSSKVTWKQLMRIVPSTCLKRSRSWVRKSKNCLKIWSVRAMLKPVKLWARHNSRSLISKIWAPSLLSCGLFSHQQSLAQSATSSTNNSFWRRSRTPWKWKDSVWTKSEGRETTSSSEKCEREIDEKIYECGNEIKYTNNIR